MRGCTGLVLLVGACSFSTELPAPAFDPDAGARYVLPFVPSDLAPPTGSVLELAEGAVIDTDAGTITGTPAVFAFRADDLAPCPLAVIVADRVAVTGHVTTRGSRSLVLVGVTALEIAAAGLLDTRGSGAAGGSGPGTGVAMAGGGLGGGGAGTYSGTCCDSGGGGAGFGATGGNGGTSGAATGGVGGTEITMVLDRLCGGSGGGGTTGPVMANCAIRGADGGAGGGGVMLGSYGTVAIAGAVNAGGRGGGGSQACGAGGGGGAGGTVVVAAPTVTIDGVVASNGGGGGGGGHGEINEPGVDGCACTTPASGGASLALGSPGGAGGAGTALGGVSAVMHSNNAGGGGGATGRLFIATAPGTTASISGIVSPASTTSAVVILELAPAP